MNWSLNLARMWQCIIIVINETANKIINKQGKSVMLDFFANCSDLCQLTVATSRRKAQQITPHALTSHALTSRAKCNQCPKNKRKITETFGQICKRKQKQLKRKRETFLAKCLFKYEYPVYLPFCFELYQTSFTLLNHRDLPVGFSLMLV